MHRFALALALALLALCACSDQPAKEEEPAKTQPPSTAPKTSSRPKAEPKVIIEELQLGEGRVAKPGDKATVFVVARLINGERIFSSHDVGSPLTVKLDKDLSLISWLAVPGWIDGISGMKVGGKRKVEVPSELAYGKKGLPARRIPGGIPLTYEFELVAVH